jgi:hypothetical protein
MFRNSALAQAALKEVISGVAQFLAASQEKQDFPDEESIYEDGCQDSRFFMDTNPAIQG